MCLRRSSSKPIDSTTNSVGISACANGAELCPSGADGYEIHPIVSPVLVELDCVNGSACTLAENYLSPAMGRTDVILE